MGKLRSAYKTAWEVFSAQKNHYWNDITQDGYGCSSGTCYCLRYAGIITSSEYFHAASNYEGVLADSKRFKKIKFDESLLQPMDIIVSWGHHVATWVGDEYKSLYECAPESSHSLATNGTGCGLHRGHTIYNCGTGTKTWDYIYRIVEEDEDNMNKYTQDTIEKAVQHGIEIANNNTYGYSNQVGSNLGHDYGQSNFDCGSFVSDCYRFAGVLSSGTIFEPNTYSGTQWSYNDILTAAGFVKYVYDPNTVKRGDVLIKDGRHTELAIGNGQQVGAHSDKDGKSGDSTGNEISVVNLYSNYWDYMYRLEVEDAEVVYPELSYGSTGTYVKELQKLLNDHGASLDVDGSFGPATKQAVIDYQTANGLYIDGIVGAVTWESLMTKEDIVPEPTFQVLEPVDLLRIASEACEGKYISTDHHKAKLKELYGEEQMQKIQNLINLAYK